MKQINVTQGKKYTFWGLVVMKIGRNQNSIGSIGSISIPRTASRAKNVFFVIMPCITAYTTSYSIYDHPTAFYIIYRHHTASYSISRHPTASYSIYRHPAASTDIQLHPAASRAFRWKFWVQMICQWEYWSFYPLIWKW